MSSSAKPALSPLPVFGAKQKYLPQKFQERYPHTTRAVGTPEGRLRLFWLVLAAGLLTSVTTAGVGFLLGGSLPNLLSALFLNLFLVSAVLLVELPKRLEAKYWSKGYQAGSPLGALGSSPAALQSGGLGTSMIDLHATLEGEAAAREQAASAR